MVAAAAASFRACVLALGLVACSEVPQKNEDQNDPTPSLVEQVQAVAGSWRITSETDALTDREIASAAQYIIADDFDFLVRVTCSDSGALRYSFTSFDKGGGPAEMQSKFYPSSTYVRGGVFVPYFLRLDSASSQRILGTAPRYNNEVEFSSNPEGVLPSKIDAYQVASADRIVARFQLTEGEETIQLSQSDAGFQGMVQPCRDARNQILADKQQQAEEEAVAISERNEEIRRGNELRTQGYGGRQSADNPNSAIVTESATEENSEPIEE